MNEDLPVDEFAGDDVPNLPMDQTQDDAVDDLDPNLSADDESHEVPEQARKASSEARFQKLANERRAKELEAENYKSQLEFYKRQAEQLQAQRQPVQEEFIDPQEKNIRDVKQSQQMLEFKMWDLNDRSEFLSKANKSEALNKYTDQVEAKLQSLRSQGINASRMTLAKEMLADDVLAKASQVPKIKREAAQRVAEARSQPVGVKPNVSRSKTEDDFEERLRDTYI